MNNLNVYLHYSSSLVNKCINLSVIDALVINTIIDAGLCDSDQDWVESETSYLKNCIVMMTKIAAMLLNIILQCRF